MVKNTENDTSCCTKRMLKSQDKSQILPNSENVPNKSRFRHQTVYPTTPTRQKLRETIIMRMKTTTNILKFLGATLQLRRGHPSTATATCRNDSRAYGTKKLRLSAYKHQERSNGVTEIKIDRPSSSRAYYNSSQKSGTTKDLTERLQEHTHVLFE